MTQQSTYELHIQWFWTKEQTDKLQINKQPSTLQIDITNYDFCVMHKKSNAVILTWELKAFEHFAEDWK